VLQEEMEYLRCYEAQLIASELPEQVKLKIHEHPLMKIQDPYGYGYGCDKCDTDGYGLVYHCEICSYDLHPHCAVGHYRQLLNDHGIDHLKSKVRHAYYYQSLILYLVTVFSLYFTFKKHRNPVIILVGPGAALVLLHSSRMKWTTSNPVQ
jgi:hypothetical protein